MNDIIKEDNVQMSIFEVAKTLNVDERTIQRYTNDIFPGKIKNGIKTWLNEVEVTKIKLELQQNQHLDRSVELPKTNLEKRLLVQQAMQILNDEVEELKAEIKIKNQKLIEAQPKIEFHDELMDSEGNYSGSEAARILGTGRQRMYDKLREEGIFLKYSALPNQSYIESGYFLVKATKTKSGHAQKQTFVTPKGLGWLRKKFYSNNHQSSF